MRKILSAVLALLLCFSCTALAAEPEFTVGICQLTQHEALDASTLGFKAALTELLGSKVAFNEQNASGDIATCISIANALIAEDVDLILANSTQALQAVYASTGDIPILGVSVTDYAAALDLDKWTGVTGVNVSGCSDLAPLNDTAELLRQLYPDAKEVGLLYCSAEANSEYQVAIMTGLLTAMGYNCTPYAFTDSNDVFSVAQNACQASDVIYVPTDNIVASCREVIRNVVDMEKPPLSAAIRASAPAAALQPSPSTTSTSAMPPAGWPMRFWSTARMFQPCPCSSARASARFTTPSSVNIWV